VTQFLLCPPCSGSARCRHCGGTGEQAFSGSTLAALVSHPCRACDGSGRCAQCWEGLVLVSRAKVPQAVVECTRPRSLS
jgi:hypothetical protein